MENRGRYTILPKKASSLGCPRWAKSCTLAYMHDTCVLFLFCSEYKVCSIVKHCVWSSQRSNTSDEEMVQRYEEEGETHSRPIHVLKTELQAKGFTYQSTSNDKVNTTNAGNRNRNCTRIVFNERPCNWIYTYAVQVYHDSTSSYLEMQVTLSLIQCSVCMVCKTGVLLKVQ